MHRTEFEIDPGWHCLPAGPMIALLKPMRSRETAAQLRQRILDHIRSEKDPELAGAAIVRSISDIQPAMPAFIQTFFRIALA